MTEYTIKQQIRDIRSITNKAIKSPESARKFLSDAGIITPSKQSEKSSKGKKK